MGPEIAIAALVAAAALALGVARRRVHRRRAQRRPGRTPERAVAVTSFAEVDRLAAAERCDDCAEPLRARGEGSTRRGERRLRFVRLACPPCERERRHYFDVTEARR